MEETLSMLANFFGILGFFTSLFAISKVYKLKKTINEINKQSAIGNNNNQNITTGAKQ